MKMGKILAKRVAIWDPELGRRVKFQPGEELPEKFEDKVTNPALFWQEPKGGAYGADNEPEADAWHKGLTIPKLKEIADDEGVDLDGVTKKKEIIAAIEAHRAAQDDEESFEEPDAGNGEGGDKEPVVGQPE